ncbi:methyltransferase domain-containing protein [Blastococcus mobilis]|uniref:Histone-lysine N-methyltransferase, H3 lysine-79 specific n=1 Tax=Blastococcus mobilis TaxID=1938746 RepID=A0A238Z2H1_9ACTN|nr:methyltransferase domain-containing protein [Blastococcus mobilis]SNR77462.1 SAM-dependent methyltransferase [Blastococcus mobilis]
MIGYVFEKVVKPPYVRARRFVGNALFDRRYHVETDGEVSIAELGLSDPRSVRYQPAGVMRLRRILPPREVSEDDVFIDFGSGKGRAVLQAALHYPFRRVYGVELSERMHEIAQRNVETCRNRLRCRDVRLIRADAATFDIPDEVTVALFNNPFVGGLFEAVVARLLESVDRHPRRLRIVYGNPVEEDALLRTGRVRPVRTLRGWRPEKEWARSNAFRLYEVTR